MKIFVQLDLVHLYRILLHKLKNVCLLIYTFQNYDFFLLSILWKKISKFNDRIWKEFIIKLYYFFQTLDLILEKNLHLILEFRE